MINNPSDKEICEILKNSKNIAVLGISRNPTRTSRAIADYLINHGYTVVGVNPGFTEVNGIKVYPSLKDIPFDIDIVDVFRRSESIDEIIPDVLVKKPKVLWLQLGIRNDSAVTPAKEEGITVVQDQCIKVEHQHCSW